MKLMETYVKKVTSKIEESAKEMWAEFKNKPVRASLKLVLFLIVANWIFDHLFGTSKS